MLEFWSSLGWDSILACPVDLEHYRSAMAEEPWTRG